MTTGKRLDVVSIGRRLAARRDEIGLDQDAVAERAGLSRPYISRLERGIVPNPKLLDLEQVAEALGMRLQELIAPEADLVETRYSLDMAEFERQVADLPPERAERVIRIMRDSLEIAGGTANLARQN